MGIKKIKKESSDLISSIPGTPKSNSLVFSKLIYSTSLNTNQTYTFSQPLPPGYYYTYLNKNNNSNNLSIQFDDTNNTAIETITFSSNSDQKIIYLYSTASSINVSQTFSYSTINTGVTNPPVSATYGNGSYVVIFNSSVSIRTSTDLFTWTNRTSGILFSSSSSAVFINNLFYVSTSNTHAFSVDAINWTTISGSSIDIVPYAIENKLFSLNTGAAGTIYRSEDYGRTWITVTTMKTANIVTALAYGNGLWAASDALGFIVTSTDLITWTSQARVTGARITDMVYGNGVFLAFSTSVASGASHRISTNGTTWTTFAGVGAVVRKNAYFSDGIFVANGLASTNGTIWTSIGSVIIGNNTDSFIANNTLLVSSDALYKAEVRNSAELQIYKI